MNAILNIKSFDCITCTRKIQYALEEETGIYFAQVLAKFGKVRVKYNPNSIQLSDVFNKMEALGHPVQYVSQAKPVR